MGVWTERKKGQSFFLAENRTVALSSASNAAAFTFTITAGDSIKIYLRGQKAYDVLLQIIANLRKREIKRPELATFLVTVH